MKFKLENVAYRTDKKHAEELAKIGFKISPETNKVYMLDGEYVVSHDYSPEIEIKTLEDLMRFVKKHGSIILHEDGRIEIDDDYE